MTEDYTAKNLLSISNQLENLEDPKRKTAHKRLLELIGADSYKSWIYPMGFAYYTHNSVTYRARSRWWAMEVTKRHHRLLLEAWSKTDKKITIVNIICESEPIRATSNMLESFD